MHYLIFYGTLIVHDKNGGRPHTTSLVWSYHVVLHKELEVFDKAGGYRTGDTARERPMQKEAATAFSVFTPYHCFY